MVRTENPPQTSNTTNTEADEMYVVMMDYAS